ncbi:MAG: F-type H+-transporting ATPase subunit epsilon [Gammaproteobacteria bacterium]|jgi:F-type H+-transporting ATPase subunit epsilon
MSTFNVDIVSAEGHVYSGAADLVIAPAVEGEIGITPNHTPLLTQMSPGEVRIQSGGKDIETLFVDGGILEIQARQVTILSDIALRGADLDEAAAEAAREAAQANLASSNSQGVAEAQATLAIALAQLKLIEKLRRRH